MRAPVSVVNVFFSNMFLESLAVWKWDISVTLGAEIDVFFTSGTVPQNMFIQSVLLVKAPNTQMTLKGPGFVLKAVILRKPK